MHALEEKGAIGIAINEDERLVDFVLLIDREIARQLGLPAVCTIGAHQVQDPLASLDQGSAPAGDDGLAPLSQ